MRLLIVLALTLSVIAETVPFLTEAEVTALATEISGESAKRSLEGLSRQHRMRGSRGFRAASEQVVQLKQASRPSGSSTSRAISRSKRSPPARSIAEATTGKFRLA